MRELRSEYEGTDYRDHFLASQALVQRLQAQLGVYTNLGADIDTTNQLQVISRASYWVTPDPLCTCRMLNGIDLGDVKNYLNVILYDCYVQSAR